ncbi:mannitol dehydrogenase family protein [Pseudopelagicola sp. nBUS_20]|uniref:mannitol dehydrogenase family protein n=1 Tax=Pseudopelagicola sp. nBUS_20 TaxID=3395317 RepID=UPI003EBFDC61
MTKGLPLLERRNPAPQPGIVHLGLGAFFRSFGVLVIDCLAKSQGGDWGIIGVSLQSSRTRDALAPQDNMYTAVSKGAGGENSRLISVLSEVVFAQEAPGELLDRMSKPAIKIVTLTVTEKGYCHVPSTGQLSFDHPDVRADILDTFPRSAVGYLVRALAQRWAAGIPPFTILSCDNLPNNGQVARNVVLSLAEAIDPNLAKWIAEEGCFPSTMVDRIVPATTSVDIERQAERAGVLDRAPVFHEPFIQWVIEDNFVDGARPDFSEFPGVQLVSDVAPFEEMKIRMLNGTHSTLAYLGYLAGYDTISETVTDHVFGKFLFNLWSNEIIPTIVPPIGVDLAQYARDLLQRYANPAIQHRTSQIAMDGSQKLPQRILGTLSDNLNLGHECRGLMLGVAAWMRYVGGIDEKGLPIDVKDPLAQQLRILSDKSNDPWNKAQNLMSCDAVFGGIGLSEKGREGIATAYMSLSEDGAQAAVAKLVS